MDLFPAEALRPVSTRSYWDVRAAIRGCSTCGLAAHRKQPVPGEGPETPLITFVGEAPGPEEDKCGRPFVGPSGKLLNNMLSRMQIDRSQVFILNGVCCFPQEDPPKNKTPRRPTKDELSACQPHLVAQLRVVPHRCLVALGSAAAAALGISKKKDAKVADLRGTWYEWEKIPVRVTYHPAYLLRNPHMRIESWQDMVAVLTRLGRPVPVWKPAGGSE